MNFIIALVVVVLIIQIGLFFLIRAKKKKDKENSVIEKYNIKTAGQAWNLINDPKTPEDDRIEIEKIYQGENQ